jgi:Holliday junction resolvasome RuvABC DNA-binding subunit
LHGPFFGTQHAGVVVEEGKAVSLKENKSIAEKLREAAVLMELRHVDPYRVAAYRKAADSVDALAQDISELFRSEGLEGLMALPGVGEQIAGAIAEMIRTGQWMQLVRLRGTQDPEGLFARVPGVGEELARRVVNALHIDSLEALEVAAHDGRLAKIPGFGPRRLATVRFALADMLARRRGSELRGDEPPVGILLDVDRQYREAAAAHRLRVIAPRRFNPRNVAWLPILETERTPWHFTALYSNTALAHRLGRTNDWVVISFRGDSLSEGQRTIVTETRGVLTGERVVRGREGECVVYYNSLTPNGASAA